MCGRVRFLAALTELERGKRNLRCGELTTLLVALGFEVKDGKRGGHQVFTHDGLADFYSGSFNCGHGRDPEIKPAYIGKIISTLKLHEQALITYLEAQS